MSTLRKNKNPYQTDISRNLQEVLNANGMQAHLAVDNQGNNILITKTHDGQARTYSVTDAQIDALRNYGSNAAEKSAYQTFTSIVKDDYYMPKSFVSARNANSPVNMGQYGYTIQDGEYGYHRPIFRDFDSPRFGRFSTGVSSILSILTGHPLGNIRRIGGRPFYDYRDPVVMERPDRYVKPGELISGSYGFYDKGTQQGGKDPLNDIKIDAQPKPVVRPKGESIPLVEPKKGEKISQDNWIKILNSHGIVIDSTTKVMKIKSDGVNHDLTYNLTDEEYKKIIEGKETVAKFNKKVGKESTAKKLSIGERLNVINNIISNDYADKITKEQLKSKNYINIKLRPEVEEELNPKSSSNLGNDVVTLDNSRMDYHTGFLNSWNTIGVVDGRMLSEDQGFYLPVKDGRAVSVGEIQAYQTNINGEYKYQMTAVINDKVFTHDISKKDYNKFLNYNDEYRLKLFDKIFKEVEIKRISNGLPEDNFVPKNLEQAKGVAKLEGNYKLVNGDREASITSAMAFKDEVSGSYLLNVTTNKDVNIWSSKISEADYIRFSQASDEEKAKMITQLLPTFSKNGYLEIEKFKTSQTVADKLSEGFNNKKNPGNTYNYKHDHSHVDVVLKEAYWKDPIYRNLDGLDPKDKEKILSTLHSTLGDKLNSLNEKEIKEVIDRSAKVSPAMKATVASLLNDSSFKKTPFIAEEAKYQIKSDKGLTIEKGKIQEEKTSLEDLRKGVKLALAGDALVNGTSLSNDKPNKEWVRGGGHGRATEIGDIAVQRLKDAEGKIIEGKYKMSAVIDGNVISHEITQKDFDKFRAVNDMQRMKLFDKIFPEVEMKTRPGHGFNLGAAILAAVSVSADVLTGVALLRDHPRPDFYATRNVYSKEGVVSPEAIASAAYSREESTLEEDRSLSDTYGRGL